jgi:hypothetical protein
MVKPPLPDSDTTCGPRNAFYAPIACTMALAMEVTKTETSRLSTASRIAISSVRGI